MAQSMSRVQSGVGGKTRGATYKLLVDREVPIRDDALTVTDAALAFMDVFKKMILDNGFNSVIYCDCKIC